MPKIFNTSWLAILLATLAFFMTGWIWYGPLLSEAWMAAEGITQEIANARLEEMGLVKWLLAALSVTLGQAIGVLMVIHPAGAKRLPACLKVTFWLLMTIAIPLMAYACIYGGYPLSGFLIDAGHLTVGYLAMAAIYAAFRGKDKVEIGDG